MRWITTRAIYLFSFALFVFTGTTVGASDVEKEKRWESQITDSLMSGEAVKLKAGTTEFLGLFTSATGKKQLGGVILLHGIGAHPAWPEVIEPLRTQLPEQGWTVLSLQMPILDNDAKNTDYVPLMDEVPPRIQAGIDYLKSKGIKNIVLMPHSMGNTMAGYYLVNQKETAIRALVAISAGLGITNDAKADNTKNLVKVTLPFFDIYGSQDNEDVPKAAKLRHDALKKTNPKYSQLRIEGANHFYVQHEDELIKRITGWLAKNVADSK